MICALTPPTRGWPWASPSRGRIPGGPPQGSAYPHAGRLASATIETRRSSVEPASSCWGCGQVHRYGHEKCTGPL